MTYSQAAPQACTSAWSGGHCQASSAERAARRRGSRPGSRPGPIFRAL